MTNSILDSVKGNLGLSADYDVFDDVLIMHINSVFATLHQLGLGPTDALEITSNANAWSEFIASTKNIGSVKTYTYLKVRLYFDPPSTSFAIAAMEKQIEELEFRLNVVREGTSWVDPTPPEELEEESW